MIGEAVAIGILGGVGLTIADKMNYLGGTNPTGKWWWERIFPQTPAARISQQAIQVQRVTPMQELNEAKQNLIFSEQMLASVNRKYPQLVVQSKYELSSRPQQQQFIEPYRPKTYP